MTANKTKQQSDKDKAAQMLERVMRVAELLAQRSQTETTDNSKRGEKTQPPRSTVQ
ncbi:MAG: hypothetical protein ACOCX5_05660 [Chloroflexota bacterium]